MKIKVKTSTGALILDVDEEMLVRDLTQLIKTEHRQQASIASYKFGYPPRNVNASAETSLRDAEIRSNDQLVVSDEHGADSHTTTATVPQTRLEKAQPTPSDLPYVYIPECSTNLILRNVPDDNSCLFNAISLAVTGSIDWRKLHLREIVANTIECAPEIYSEAILGRPLQEYCLWIRKSESWGGAIELGILSKHLNVRIEAYDIELSSPITFQDENKPPDELIVLIYSGIHYDTLVTNKVLSTSRIGDVGKWASDEGISEAAQKLVKLLQSRNYATNTTKFRLRCLECYEVLVGETGASLHANRTGHVRFGEV